MCCSQSQTGFPHGARTASHGVFGYGNNGRQGHDGQYKAACQSGFPDGQVKSVLQEGNNDCQPEKSVDYRRNAVQQFDDRLQKLSHFRRGNLCQINGNCQSEGQCDQNGKETDPKRSSDQRKNTEDRRGGGRRKPFGTQQDILDRNRFVLNQMKFVCVGLDQYFRDESDDTRVLFYLFRDLFSGTFVFRAQFCFGI